MDIENNNKIKNLLNEFIIPDTGRPLKEIGKIVSFVSEGNKCEASIEFGYHDNELIKNDRIFSEVIRENSNFIDIDISINTDVKSHGVQSSLSPIENVKNIIAVASGKGGVGKSTIASNLAISLHQDGATVGILDADIYGPSIPLIFGIEDEQPTSNDGKRINPLKAYGIEVMSIGFLIDPKKPTIWRGPMVTSALNQLLNQTIWGGLDYLIVDMPPGTGDIQLSLSQQVPVSGCVIVTTPQDIALLDARKGLEMFRKVSIPILGIIENMSTHICSKCQHEETIFGEGGGTRISEEYNIDLLGKLPLTAAVRSQTDSGKPSVISEPDSEYSKKFRAGAKKMAIKLAATKKDFSQHFPKIVVEES